MQDPDCCLLIAGDIDSKIFRGNDRYYRCLPGFIIRSNRRESTKDTAGIVADFHGLGEVLKPFLNLRREDELRHDFFSHFRNDNANEWGRF